MKMSVREARAQFAAAIASAERGERVTITRHGKPVAEIGPPVVQGGVSETVVDLQSRLAAIRKKLGIDKLPADPRTDEEWMADHRAWRRETSGPERFGDPAI